MQGSPCPHPTHRDDAGGGSGRSGTRPVRPRPIRQADGRLQLGEVMPENEPPMHTVLTTVPEKSVIVHLPSPDREPDEASGSGTQSNEENGHVAAQDPNQSNVTTFLAVNQTSIVESQMNPCGNLIQPSETVIQNQLNSHSSNIQETNPGITQILIPQNLIYTRDNCKKQLPCIGSICC